VKGPEFNFQYYQKKKEREVRRPGWQERGKQEGREEGWEG
jgi:hypothetical protein